MSPNLATLREAESATELTSRLDQLLDEISRLRIDNRQLQARLADAARSSASGVQAQQVLDLQRERAELSDSLHRERRVGSELTQRLEILERMYLSTRSELRDAQEEVAELRRIQAESTSTVVAAPPSTFGVVQRLPPSHARREPDTAMFRESFSNFDKQLRKSLTHRDMLDRQEAEDGSSVSVLWNFHDDLKTRIDELITTCMSGNLFDARGEQVVRGRILEHVKEVSREYEGSVLNSLKVCHEHIENVLSGLGHEGEEAEVGAAEHATGAE